MNKNRQFCVANFSNAICLGKDILEQKPSEILYEISNKNKVEQKIKNKLINELAEFLTPAQILYSSLDDLKKIKYFLYKNKTPKESFKYLENMLLKHINNVGEIQAIKDLQRGLSILNKNRRKSPIEVKNILIEDGIFGPKTKNALENACKTYSLNVIKKYFLKGIINNIIFDTKNNQNIDTIQMINDVIEKLKGY